jgi:hypothetical protein
MTVQKSSWSWLVLVAGLTALVPPGTRADSPKPESGVERSFVLWSSCPEKAVRGERLACWVRLVEESGKTFVEIESLGDRGRHEIRHHTEISFQTERVKVRVLEPEIKANKFQSVRLLVQMSTGDTAYTLFNKRVSVNYGLGITLANGQFIPGIEIDD